MIKCIKAVAAFMILILSAQAAAAQSAPEWRYFAPDNTGIGSDLNHSVIKEDRFGNIFGGGHDFFYRRGSIYRFKNGIYTNWGNMDGYLKDGRLGNYRINDLAFDYSNRMWAATDSGVVSYDGQVWKHYFSSNSGLLYDRITSIAIDPVTNYVWVRAQLYGQPLTGGVAFFNGQVWKTFNATNSSLPTQFLSTICVDAQGNKWIGSNSGLIKFDGLNWILYNSANSGLLKNDVVRVQVDDQNRIWVSTGDNLQTFDGHTSWTTISGYPGGSANSDHFYVRGNKLLIAERVSSGRILFRDGNTWTAYPGGPAEMFGAYIDTLGTLWVPGKGFVQSYDGTGWKTYTRHCSGLAEYNSGAVFADSRNRKWFANGNGGIQVYDCPKWYAFGPLNQGLWPSPQSQTTIGTSISEDKGNGDIWMTYGGTNGFAVKIPNGNINSSAAWTTYTNDPALGTSTGQLHFSDISKVCANHRGLVAFIGMGGEAAFIYNRITNTWATHRTRFAGGPLMSNVYAVATDSAGALYFGGLDSVDRFYNGAWSRMAPATGLDGIRDIHFDAAGNMWVATANGVWRYNGAAWTHWTEANAGLSGPRVSAITSYGNKIYAAACEVVTWPYYGGISVFDGTSWTAIYQASSPLAHYQINDVETDTLGNLWISTIEGTNVYRAGGTKGFECLDDDRKSWQAGPPFSTGIKQSNISIAGLEVYPNPATDHINVSFSLTAKDIVSIELLDMQGRLVKQVFNGLLPAGTQHLPFGISGLSKGLYLCRVSGKQGTAITKISVQ